MSDIIRIGEDELIVSQVQKIPQTADDMRALFVAEQDVKESSRQLYSRTLKQYFKWIEEEYPLLPFIDALKILKPADVNRYKDSLQQRLSSKLSICSYVIVVRKFYQWAEAKRWYPNIARQLKTPLRKQEYRKEHLSREKTAELFKYYRKDRKKQKTKKAKRPLPPEMLSRDYAIVTLMIKTGLRTIEVARADIGDITYRMEQRILKVWGKGRSDKEEDFVALTDETFAPIAAYIQQYRKTAKPTEPLFCSVSTQNKGERLTTKTINTLCTEGLKHIGLYDESMKHHRPYTAHSFRHTTAVSLFKVGADITEVQAVLRHSSIDTTKIYLRSIEEETRLKNPAEKKLDNYF